MNINITALFVCLDDFSKLFESSVKKNSISNISHRIRKGYLSLSEMLFIEILYQFSPFKDFKRFYHYGIQKEHRSCFNKIPSYQRFVTLKKNYFCQ